jgi:hypothetical protein
MFSKRYFSKLCTAINHLIFVANEKKILARSEEIIAPVELEIQ